MQPPSFIWDAWNSYLQIREVDDAYHRYKALESLGASLIKYAATTFALLADDRDRSSGVGAARPIFRSSSLGGWVDTIDHVCAQHKELSPKVQEYCDLFSHYKRHGARRHLDSLAEGMNEIIGLFRNKGYEIEEAKALNIRRSMRLLVLFRNKCAHGSLDIPFFDAVGAPLERVLRILLRITPFDDFTLWGKYGPKAMRLRGPLPRKVLNRRRHSFFWIESPLLQEGFTEKIPFLVYKEDTQRIYCLNGPKKEDSTMHEFIDYGTGQVLYRQVEHGELETLSTDDVAFVGFREEKYKEHRSTLVQDLDWHPVHITQSAIETQGSEAGVYLFVFSAKVCGKQVDNVVYVGKAEDFKVRLRHYVRTKKGYDLTRPEISRMFSKYGSSLRLVFARVAPAQLAAVEWSIYETLRPEFNQIAPPKPQSLESKEG